MTGDAGSLSRIPSVSLANYQPPAMVTMTKRRRFQAPITSFFTTEATCSDSVSSQQSHQNRVPFSSLPVSDEIQSSLLTVGMRVRKSVPEGYKTHKTLYPTPPYGHPSCFPESRIEDYETHPASTRYAGYAELMPFCGLHKIGGMAVQPMPEASSDSYRDAPFVKVAEHGEEPDPWSLPSTQQSVDSERTATSSRKRSFRCDQEEDDDGDGYVGYSYWNQQLPSSPFSYTRTPYEDRHLAYPAGQPFRNSPESVLRPLAMPRSRLASSKNKKSALERPEHLGFGAVTSTSAPDHEVDFQDADFLKAPGEADPDDWMDGC